MSQALSSGAWRRERSGIDELGNPAYCAKCAKECSGEVLRVENRHFHAHCFVCRACGRSLASLGYYIKDGHFYCYDDFHHFFGSKCFGCGQFVEGEVITVMGSTFHVGCFKCGRCKKNFPPGEKVSFDGNMYLCQKCKQDKKKEADEKHTCAGCNDVIRGGQALLALDKQWHLWCFKCTKCNALLAGEYMGRNGLPYCEKDYQLEFGVRCAACKGYITGKVLQAGEKHFHPSCSRCAKCKRMFGEGEEMYLQGSEIWHPDCNNPTSAEPNNEPYIPKEPPIETRRRASLDSDRKTESYRASQQHPPPYTSPPPPPEQPRQPSPYSNDTSYNGRNSTSPESRAYSTLPRNYKTQEYVDRGYQTTPRSSGQRTPEPRYNYEGRKTPDQGYYGSSSSGRASRSPPVEEISKLNVNGEESEPGFPAPPPPARNTSIVSDWKSRYNPTVERSKSVTTYDRYNRPNYDSGYNGGSQQGSTNSPAGERFTSSASLNIRPKSDSRPISDTRPKSVADDYRIEQVVRRREATNTNSAARMQHRKSMPAMPVNDEKLQIYPYEQLKTTNYRMPSVGVDRTRLEAHLSQEEFLQVFRMTKSEFYRMPKWKQDNIKKQNKLF